MQLPCSVLFHDRMGFALSVIYLFMHVLTDRSQWLRRLRCGSAVARLLGLRVRIPPPQKRRCLFHVNVESCQVEVSAAERSLVQRSSTECSCVCVCVCVCVWVYVCVIECNLVQPQPSTAAVSRYKVSV